MADARINLPPPSVLQTFKNNLSVGTASRFSDYFSRLFSHQDFHQIKSTSGKLSPEGTFFSSGDALLFARMILSDKHLAVMAGPVLICHLLRFAPFLIDLCWYDRDIVPFNRALQAPNQSDVISEKLCDPSQLCDPRHLLGLGPFSPEVKRQILTDLRPYIWQDPLSIINYWERFYPEGLKAIAHDLCRAGNFDVLPALQLHDGLCKPFEDQPQVARIFPSVLVRHPQIAEKLMEHYKLLISPSPSGIETSLEKIARWDHAGVPKAFQVFSIESGDESSNAFKLPDYRWVLSGLSGTAPRLSESRVRKLSQCLHPWQLQSLPFDILLLMFKILPTALLQESYYDYVQSIFYRNEVSFLGASAPLQVVDQRSHDVVTVTALSEIEKLKQLKSCNLPSKFWIAYLKAKPENWKNLLDAEVLTHYQLVEFIDQACKTTLLDASPELAKSFYQICEKGMIELAKGTTRAHKVAALEYAQLLTAMTPFDWAEELYGRFTAYGFAVPLHELHRDQDFSDDYSEIPSYKGLYSMDRLSFFLQREDILLENKAKLVMHFVVQALASYRQLPARKDGWAYFVSDNESFASNRVLDMLQPIIDCDDRGAFPVVEGTRAHYHELPFNPYFVYQLAVAFDSLGLKSDDPLVEQFHSFSWRLMTFLFFKCTSTSQVDALEQIFTEYRQKTTGVFFEVSHRKAVAAAMISKMRENKGAAAFVAARFEVGVIRKLAVDRYKEISKLGDEFEFLQDDSCADGAGAGSAPDLQHRKRTPLASGSDVTPVECQSEVEKFASSQQQVALREPTLYDARKKQGQAPREEAPDAIMLRQIIENFKSLTQRPDRECLDVEGIRLAELLAKGHLSPVDLEYLKLFALRLPHVYGGSVVSLVLAGSEVEVKDSDGFIQKVSDLKSYCEDEAVSDDFIKEYITGTLYTFDQLGEHLSSLAHLLLRTGRVGVLVGFIERLQDHVLHMCNVYVHTWPSQKTFTLLASLGQHTTLLTREVIARLINSNIFNFSRMDDLIYAISQFTNAADFCIQLRADYYSRGNLLQFIANTTCTLTMKQNKSLWPLHLLYNQDDTAVEIYAEHGDEEFVVNKLCMLNLIPIILKFASFPPLEQKNPINFVPQQDEISQKVFAFILKNLSSAVGLRLSLDQISRLVTISPDLLSSLKGHSHKIDFHFWKLWLKNVLKEQSKDFVFAQQLLLENDLVSPSEMWSFIVEEVHLVNVANASPAMQALYQRACDEICEKVASAEPLSKELYDEFVWINLSGFFLGGDVVGRLAQVNARFGAYEACLYLKESRLLLSEVTAHRLFSVTGPLPNGMGSLLVYLFAENLLTSTMIESQLNSRISQDSIARRFVCHAIFNSKAHPSHDEYKPQLLGDFSRLMASLWRKIPRGDSKEHSDMLIESTQIFIQEVTYHIFDECRTPQDVTTILPCLKSYRRIFPELYDSAHNASVVKDGLSAFGSKKASFFSKEYFQDIMLARRQNDTLYQQASRRLESFGVPADQAKKMLVGIHDGVDMTLLPSAPPEDDEQFDAYCAGGAGAGAGGGGSAWPGMWSDVGSRGQRGDASSSRDSQPPPPSSWQ
jgi:hypothetical protein